jgi:hypothetical protein
MLAHSGGFVKHKMKSSALKRRNTLIEYLAAAGKPLKEIAEHVGLKSHTVSTILKQPESIARVEEINKQIRDQIVSEAAQIGQKFDEEAPHAFGTLKRLNRGETDDIDNPVPHAVSLQAATQILDRAPSVPSRKGEDGDRHLHIHLPQKQFDNAQQALEDVGLLPRGEDAEES